MTKDSKFVKARYLDKDLPPEGTITEYGEIYSYNANYSIDVGRIVLHTITGDCHQDTLEINNVKLLDCEANRYRQIALRKLQIIFYKSKFIRQLLIYILNIKNIISKKVH